MKMTDKTETALDLDGLAAFCKDAEELGPLWRKVEAQDKVYAASYNLLKLALTQRDQIAAKDARIRELEDVLQYLDISDKDASLIRGLLDVTDIWDKHDKAIDRMLSCFPNDPLNIKLASPNQSKRKDG